jgi:hypothetical protein
VLPVVGLARGVLKHVRLSNGGLDVCGELERLLCETDTQTLPALALSHGWHWTRLFLLACLNAQLLHAFLESLLSDSEALQGHFVASAPVRNAALRTRLGALAAALNGIHCELEHWGTLLLEQGSKWVMLLPPSTP